MDKRFLKGGDECDFEEIELKSATWEGADIEIKVAQEEYVRKFPAAYDLARMDRGYRWVEFIGSISRERFDKVKYRRRHISVDNWCVVAKDISPMLAVMEDGVIVLHPFST